MSRTIALPFGSSAFGKSIGCSCRFLASAFAFKCTWSKHSMTS